jgi:ribosomal protein L21
MLDFAVCEISGKQYKLVPNQPIEVDYLGEIDKEISAQVLILSEDGKLKVGTPYLKETLTLDYIESIKADKIRVAKFHAKANYRKVTGIRPKKTRVVLSVKK